MTRLKELRNEKKLTQQQAANLAGVSLRSYKSYENEEKKLDSAKYRFIFNQLLNYTAFDETHGILELEDIRRKCSEVFESYDVQFCYLFGSYAKNNALPTSDVDLLISANVKGLKFYGLIEELRTALSKKLDVLDVGQLKDNLELTKEILKDGVKIYG